MKNLKSHLSILVMSSLCLTFNPAVVYAQVSDETREQKEFEVEDREDYSQGKSETAKEILEILKTRAQAKLKEKHRQRLLRHKISIAVLRGFESNPLNDQVEKADMYTEEDFNFNWLPSFNENFEADIGYRLANQHYDEQSDLSTFDNAVNATFKIFPLDDHDFFIQPGAEFEALQYPDDENSSYDDTKAFLKFKHYMDADWHYGGKYEYSYKVYDKKVARNDAKGNIPGLSRTDYRNTAELYAAKNISKYTVKLRGKIYRNNSNDQYQNSYDYDAYRGYLTLSGSFLKDDKLYVTFTPDFERKNYHRRLAVNTARADNVLQYKFDAYYTLPKNLELSYGFTHKTSNSNASAGEFTDITNVLGLTYKF